MHSPQSFIVCFWEHFAESQALKQTGYLVYLYCCLLFSVSCNFLVILETPVLKHSSGSSSDNNRQLISRQRQER